MTDDDPGPRAPRDDEGLRWFRGSDATPLVEGPGHRPREVTEVVRMLQVTAGLQIVVAGVIGALVAVRFEPAAGLAIGAVLFVTALVSFLTAWRLGRGSERARRLVAWPLDDDSWLFASSSWARTRLRTQRAARWFAVHAEARASAPTRRSGGPR